MKLSFYSNSCTTYLCFIGDFLAIWQTFATVDHLWVIHYGVELLKFISPVLPCEANFDAVKVFGDWVVPGNAVGVG